MEKIYKFLDSLRAWDNNAVFAVYFKPDRIIVNAPVDLCARIGQKQLDELIAASGIKDAMIFVQEENVEIRFTFKPQGKGSNNQRLPLTKIIELNKRIVETASMLRVVYLNSITAAQQVWNDEEIPNDLAFTLIYAIAFTSGLDEC